MTVAPSKNGGPPKHIHVSTDAMRLVVPDHIMLKLETWCATAEGMEISGLGTIRREGSDFIVSEVYLLDVGSSTFTQIDPKNIMEILKQGVDPGDLKLWFHRHPVGNGVPGQHNWSGTDEKTIQETPLGVSREMVKWSISAVRTPRGWVARIDHYELCKTGHITVSQPLSPEDHDAVHRARPKSMARELGLYRSWTQTGGTLPHGVLPTTPRVVKMVSGKKGKKGRHKIPKWNRALRDRLLEVHLDSATWTEMAQAIRGGRPPGWVSQRFGIDLYSMAYIGLISTDEADAEMERIAELEMRSLHTQYLEEDPWI